MIVIIIIIIIIINNNNNNEIKEKLKKNGKGLLLPVIITLLAVFPLNYIIIYIL